LECGNSLPLSICRGAALSLSPLIAAIEEIEEAAPRQGKSGNEFPHSKLLQDLDRQVVEADLAHASSRP
jgi:hypothetical protein